MLRVLKVYTKYLILPGVFAVGLMNIFKPNEEEVNKIRGYSKTNDQFSAVLRAAADPKSKPMYRQKPGESHPAPEIINESKAHK